MTAKFKRVPAPIKYGPIPHPLRFDKTNQNNSPYSRENTNHSGKEPRENSISTARANKGRYILNGILPEREERLCVL